MNGSALTFENLKSSDPGTDVEQALSLGSHLVNVYASVVEDVERLKQEYIEGYTRVGIRDRTGRYFDPPLLGGVLSYSVDGFIPTGRFHPIEKDRMLYRIAFKVEVSANPRRDVERALRFGCTKVSVGVNYEPSEDEKREQEELNRQEEEEAEKEGRFLQRWR